MKELSLKPTIFSYETMKEFSVSFSLGEDDLIITNSFIYENFKNLNLKCYVMFQEEYGKGEPSDDMVEAMSKDIKKDYKRIIAIGGGTVIDISKLFSLKTITPVLDLFDGKIKIEKKRELILVPTTCGTGSEVTNISILALNSRNTKKGLAEDAMYADYAILVPELLKGLPFKFFATSSIDALIHAIESSLSPKATETSKMFGYRAIEMILTGYKEIALKGQEARIPLLKDFLLASNYAGIAFGNAGCAAVHALSYPLGATFHVPHGESNYAIFMGVMNNYMEINQEGEIEKLNTFISKILGCDISNVYGELEKLLSNIMIKKSLHEYGMTKEQIIEFSDSVLENQGRLLANNYVELSREKIIKIYSELY
jgi:4-hydroxybutyrate dehydrogenase